MNRVLISVMFCLCQAFIKRGNQTLIKLGDKEVDYNFDFKLYITTKLSNPHYTPEISTKATIVNFAVKEQGLEAQLLNTVVKCERPDLDKQKNELVVKVAAGKRTQVCACTCVYTLPGRSYTPRSILAASWSPVVLVLPFLL